jgi:hypothetical protein
MDHHARSQLIVLITVVVGLATLAAIVLPGDDLGWPRLGAAFVAFFTVTIGGSWALARRFNKEN